MSIVVLKFGGTSLKNIDKNSDFLKHIQNHSAKGDKIVVVVSAIGRMGEPYSTDTLINQLELIDKKIDPKKKDFIMSCGEIISAAIVAHLLESIGLKSEPLTGFQAGILTDNDFNTSKILEININRIIKHIDEGKIVVVAGFQGMTKEMEITTLGRGGSDTTAVALGAYLDADEVYIYTDVPGVALMDPTIVPNPLYLRKISYMDMYNLASNGASVIHPRAVKIGMKHHIPIRILSTFNNDEGTLISEEGNDNIIKGFAIKPLENKTLVSFFYNPKYYNTIMEKVIHFIKENNKIIFKTDSNHNCIEFVVNDENVKLFGNKLYNYFLKN
ncbi:aspartate kinase [Tissierella creatinini]|nr:aspartate kinase [Tissierella creatinini]TJX65591.1 aspartate kinase [Soehngenia saccharolytica]